MIDSAHPSVERVSGNKDDSPAFQPGTKSHIREKITRCYQEATRLIAAWEPPVWRDGRGEMRAVLLRARKGRHGKEGVGDREGDVVSVQSDGMMGWRGYAGGLVDEAVIEVEGNHFSIFDTSNVSHGSSLSSASRFPGLGFDSLLALHSRVDA